MGYSLLFMAGTVALFLPSRLFTIGGAVAMAVGVGGTAAHILNSIGGL